jgi:hypothetical protein
MGSRTDLLGGGGGGRVGAALAASGGGGALAVCCEEDGQSLHPRKARDGDLHPQLQDMIHGLREGGSDRTARGSDGGPQNSTDRRTPTESVLVRLGPSRSLSLTSQPNPSSLSAPFHRHLIAWLPGGRPPSSLCARS